MLRFNAFLGLLLAATLSIKLISGGRIDNPSNGDILTAAQTVMVKQGLDSAGITTFAGRDALLVGKNDCVMYLVPVAHQGWHQDTLRKYMGDDQGLWFSFEGELTANAQPRWSPLLRYYAEKAIRYTGIPATYHPVYGVVASKQCNLTAIDWASLPSLPFKSEVGGSL